MRVFSRSAVPVWLGAVALLAALAIWRHSAGGVFSNPDVPTGGMLLAVSLGVSLYGVRRRLPMLPLGRASTWLAVHVIGGFATIGLYALHVRTLWPTGVADQALALSFFAVFASGVVGHGLQALLPGRLNRTGDELIYERIPAEIARLRADAESTILASATASGHDTLSTYYDQTLAWYFEKPRFALQHVLGTRAAEAWEQHRLGAVGRVLAEEERPYLQALAQLCRRKRGADAQHALQGLLRAWTFIHLPAATGFLVLALWHTVLAIVYVG